MWDLYVTPVVEDGRRAGRGRADGPGAGDAPDRPVAVGVFSAEGASTDVVDDAGRELDGEAALRWMVEQGFMRAEDAERAIAEKRAHEAAKAGG